MQRDMLGVGVGMVSLSSSFLFAARPGEVNRTVRTNPYDAGLGGHGGCGVPSGGVGGREATLRVASGSAEGGHEGRRRGRGTCGRGADARVGAAQGLGRPRRGVELTPSSPPSFPFRVTVNGDRRPGPCAKTKDRCRYRYGVSEGWAGRVLKMRVRVPQRLDERWVHVRRVDTKGGDVGRGYPLIPARPPLRFAACRGDGVMRRSKGEAMQAPECPRPCTS
ncbi:hypothetical protein K438DRAFT_2114279 [Mycena galopus ATCC 62051]|nr:hypothetical protein K438DRAFT_2114279 [Mycena galopus ATCC 62051]